MIIKKKIHCAPKKGSFLRCFAHLLPLLKGQPLGRCPPSPPPTLQWLTLHTKSKWEWPGARRGLPSLPLSQLWPHFPPPPLSGSSHTCLLVLPKPTCRAPPCRHQYLHLPLSTCWFSKLHAPSPPGLGSGVALSRRPSLTTLGTSALFPPLRLHQRMCSASPPRICSCLSPQTRWGAP